MAKDLLEFLKTESEKPKPFGSFHIIALLIIAALSASSIGKVLMVCAAAETVLAKLLQISNTRRKRNIDFLYIPYLLTIARCVLPRTSHLYYTAIGSKIKRK